MADSFELHLRAERKSEKTIRTYTEAALWFVILLGRYSDSYANNQFRALQQFFKWYATEDPDEPRQNPMANLKPPKLGMKLVPVFAGDELADLVAACKGGGYRNRRDAAIISLFRDTGIRLSELTGLTTADLSLREREATVNGKGDRQRTIKFTYDTARAIDRFLRERARHQDGRMPALWLGLRGPMTPSGASRRKSHGHVRATAPRGGEATWPRTSTAGRGRSCA